MAYWYDQTGGRHASQHLAWLANVWDYDPTTAEQEAENQAHYEAEYAAANPGAETAAEWLERFRNDRNLSAECYAPGHLCDDCMPF